MYFSWIDLFFIPLTSMDSNTDGLLSIERIISVVSVLQEINKTLNMKIFQIHLGSLFYEKYGLVFGFV